MQKVSGDKYMLCRRYLGLRKRFKMSRNRAACQRLLFCRSFFLPLVTVRRFYFSDKRNFTEILWIRSSLTKVWRSSGATSISVWLRRWSVGITHVRLRSWSVSHESLQHTVDLDCLIGLLLLAQTLPSDDDLPVTKFMWALGIHQREYIIVYLTGVRLSLT